MPVKARKGFRAITVYLPVAQHDLLGRIAEENFRSIEQQGSAMLTEAISLKVNAAITRAMNGTEAVTIEADQLERMLEVEDAPAE